MKKALVVGLPFLLILPLLLLILGMGSASIEAARAACAVTTHTTGGGSFGIGTLNWRGASHFTRNPHPGERHYSVRVPNMVAKVNGSGASIVGFQEFEPPQAEAFLAATQGQWALVKGKRPNGKESSANAIAYQPGAWAVDDVRYVAISYGGENIRVPLVRFTSSTGMGSVWVLNTHHPANVVQGSNAVRDDAVRAEAEALNAISTIEPETPLLLTGDMNDRARFKELFVSLAPGWHAANPSDQQIDWVMGSPQVAFVDPIVDSSTNDSAHSYTDHPFVHATAQIAATGGPEQRGSAALGIMPTGLQVTPGVPVNGEVLIANANIKTRAGFDPGVRALTAQSPDFITLNEVEDVPLPHMKPLVAGYDAYREPLPAGEDDANALGNAIMWRSDTWKLLVGGRVKIVEDDHTIFNGANKNWDRFAAWGIFQRTDGAVVSVIAVHHMTNVYKFPQQWGNPPMTRADQYDLGMDYLIQLTDVLQAYGPVFVGGDMNSHAGDGHAAAATRMAAAGFANTKDTGVIYNFYAAPVTVVKTWQISAAAVHSDHPALFTRMSMNGAGPSSGSTTTLPGGCPPCPSTPITAPVLLPGVTGPESMDAATVAAQAAYQAGFRGQDLVIAVAIARVESTWNPGASNGTHFGLWQIAKSHQGKVPGWNEPADIYDPLLNAQYAFALYQARPGAGEAKFADWIPFEKQDYRTYLEQARQAVSQAGVAETGTSQTGCSNVSLPAELSPLVSARINAMLAAKQGLCTLSWTNGAPCTYDNQCPKVVDALYGGPGVGRGFGDGQDVAQGIINAGLAQAHGTGLDPLPPVGAVVSYNTGDGVGHVAIYMGNGQIFGNDYGCTQQGSYGCVGFADVHAPGGSVTWALPTPGFDLGGNPAQAA